MALVRGETEESRQGENSATLKNNRWVASTKFMREFIVWADCETETEADVLLAVGVPGLFSSFLGAYCVKRVAREVDTVNIDGTLYAIYHVKCDYDSSVDVSQSTTPPEARTPEIRWYCEQFEELLHYDALDEDIPIVTSAYEPIPQTIQVARPILEIKRFEYWPFDPDIILYYVNTINSAAFYGAPVKTCQMLDINSEKEVIDGEFYSNTTYKIMFNLKHDGNFNLVPNTLLGRPLDYGTQFIKSGKDYATKNIVDGEIVEVLLDGMGAPIDPSTDSPVYLSYNLYPLQNFNNLNLGPYF